MSIEKNVEDKLVTNRGELKDTEFVKKKEVEVSRNTIQTGSNQKKGLKSLVDILGGSAVTTAVPFIVAIWMPLIINKFGSDIRIGALRLVKDGKMTGLSITITVIIYAALLGSSIAKVVKEKRDKVYIGALKVKNKEIMAKNELDEVIMRGFAKINSEKYRYLAPFLAKPKSHISEILMNPMHDLMILSNEIEHLMEEMIRPDNEGKKGHVSVIMAYNLMDKHNWRWVDGYHFRSKKSPDDLGAMASCDTDADKSHSNYQVYFHKADAVTENKYVLDSEDKLYDNQGVVIYGEVQVHNNRKGVLLGRLIYAITTYGWEFQAPDDTLQKNIELTLDGIFYEAIRIELAKLYFKSSMPSIQRT